MTGGLFLLMYHRFGITPDLIHGCLFVALLIPISWIDARWYIIPNAIIIVGLLLGLSITVAISAEQQDWHYLFEHLIGALIGAGALLLIAILGKAIFRKEAMGGGDIKLMALIGMFLGAWHYLLIVIVLSAFIGSIAGNIADPIYRAQSGASNPLRTIFGDCGSAEPLLGRGDVGKHI